MYFLYNVDTQRFYLFQQGQSVDPNEPLSTPENMLSFTDDLVFSKAVSKILFDKPTDLLLIQRINPFTQLDRKDTNT